MPMLGAPLIIHGPSGFLNSDDVVRTSVTPMQPGMVFDRPRCVPLKHAHLSWSMSVLCTGRCNLTWFGCVGKYVLFDAKRDLMGIYLLTFEGDVSFPQGPSTSSGG